MISFGSRPMSAQRAASTSRLLRELLGWTADEVPVLGVARGDRQCALLAAAADADRRVRALRALGLVAGVLELVVLAVEVGGLLAQQAGQHLAGFLEPVEALLDGAQLDAVGARLLLVPAGADPELEASVGDDVERGGHVGQYRRVAVVDAGDQGAQAQSSWWPAPVRSASSSPPGRARCCRRRSGRSGRRSIRTRRRRCRRRPARRPACRPRWCLAVRF